MVWCLLLLCCNMHTHHVTRKKIHNSMRCVKILTGARALIRFSKQSAVISKIILFWFRQWGWCPHLELLRSLCWRSRFGKTSQQSGPSRVKWQPPCQLFFFSVCSRYGNQLLCSPKLLILVLFVFWKLERLKNIYNQNSFFLLVNQNSFFFFCWWIKILVLH